MDPRDRFDQFEIEERFDHSCSVVVPVYNSQQILPELVARLGEALLNHVSQFEVVLVNDGSRDESWRVICGLSECYRWIKGINLMRNYGQHNALLCGVRTAKYDVIVTMDDDLQHPPEEIPKLLHKLGEGHDVVYGMPLEEKHGLWRDWASRITKLALRSAIGADTARHASAFRTFRSQVREAFADYRGPFVSIDVLLTWGTTRFSAVSVRHDLRRSGESQYTFRKLMTHALNMMTGFSVLPLQLASLVGFGFTIFGLLVFFYVIGRYLVEGGSVPGFPFLASIVAIFSGAQLCALGIAGEYLARMYQRIMQLPGYVVRSVVDAGPEPLEDRV